MNGYLCDFQEKLKAKKEDWEFIGFVDCHLADGVVFFSFLPQF